MMHLHLERKSINYSNWTQSITGVTVVVHTFICICNAFQNMIEQWTNINMHMNETKRAVLSPKRCNAIPCSTWYNLLCQCLKFISQFMFAYTMHIYIASIEWETLAQLRRSGKHWMCEVCVHLILKIHFHIYIANRHNSHLLTNALTEIDLHEHQQFIHSHLHPALCDASSINSKCAKMAMVILIWNVFVLLDIKCSLCDDFTITSLMLNSSHVSAEVLVTFTPFVFVYEIDAVVICSY